MYVVTYNDQVLLGPIAWNAKMFNSVIEDDTGITVNIQQSQRDQVPLDLGNGIKIRHAVEDRPSINLKLEIYEGPFWTFTESTGVYSYQAISKPVDLLKHELTQLAAFDRWTKEQSGVKVTIQGQEVTVDTTRGNRDIFVQKFLLMGENDTVNWKFPEGWLTLTKAELGLCVSSGAAHVQSEFNRELGLLTQISTATTLVELDAVALVFPGTEVEEPRGRRRPVEPNP